LDADGAVIGSTKVLEPMDDAAVKWLPEVMPEAGPVRD
jgi:hypothetical protein